MNLDALRIFLRVAETGSFSRAAAQLGMPKSRASQRVRALEQSLGCALFQRTTRVVRLTEEGERLLVRAPALLAELDALRADLDDAATARGRVRLDLPVALGRRLVLHHLADLLDAHPALELHLSLTDRRVHAFREGFDVVLRVGEAEEPGLVGRRLGHLVMMNAASPAYLLRHGVPEAIEDLDHHLIVNYSSRLDASPAVFEHPSGEGSHVERPVRARVTVNNTDAYQAAARAGLGIVQLPRVAVAPDDTGLVEVLPGHPCAPMPVWLLHTHGRAPPRRVRVVLDWLAGLIGPALRDAGSPLMGDGPPERELAEAPGPPARGVRPGPAPGAPFAARGPAPAPGS